jgi:hypothetical protein
LTSQQQQYGAPKGRDKCRGAAVAVTRNVHAELIELLLSAALLFRAPFGLQKLSPRRTISSLSFRFFFLSQRVSVYLFTSKHQNLSIH